MELLLQMTEYENRAGGREKLNLEEFEYVATKLSLPETQEWAKELLGGSGGAKETNQALDEYYSREQ
jgi:putative hydrolase of HD superfamily